MASRISPRTRQAIINFPDEPKRGQVARFCKEQGISKASFYKIKTRAAQDGPEAAALPRSTAPLTQAKHTPEDVEELALKIRSDLTRAGWDAGPVSVAAAMKQKGMPQVSRATLARIFTRHDVVTPQPHKKPRSAYRRFTYPDPNGCWQLDGMDYTLDNGITRCILQVQDDNSRVVLASLVAKTESSAAAVKVVSTAIANHGAPKYFLTDNALAFNQSRRGTESELEKYLKLNGVTPITGRPGKPTTQGKNERLHQTLQRFLDANRPIYSVKRLTALLEQFDEYYNYQRPHQALSAPGSIPDTTPAQAYQARPKAQPSPAPITTRTPVKTWTTPKPYKMTGSTPTGEEDTWEADRRVTNHGHLSICNTRIYVGRHLAGQTLHTIYNNTTITIIDPNGVILAELPRPPRTGKRHHYTINPNRLRSDETEMSTK